MMMNSTPEKVAEDSQLMEAVHFHREQGQPSAKSRKIQGNDNKHEIIVESSSQIYFIMFVCTSCFLYALLTAFLPEPWGLLSKDKYDCDGVEYCLCPRKTICATNLTSMVLLGLSRGSAYLDYPLYVLVFLTKANNFRTALSLTFLIEWVPLYDTHHLHSMCGTIIGLEVVFHSFFHMLRWGLDGNLTYLYSTATGRSGMISLFCTFLIVWPMRVGYLKAKLSFELRKGLHYLSIVWGISICFHAPTQHIGIIIGLAVAIYIADFLVGMSIKTNHILETKFQRLDNAVSITFKKPESFNITGFAYAYICIPWVSKSEWHAFSLFTPFDNKGDELCVCVAKTGDWTGKLHQLVNKPTTRPIWICGPYTSPFFRAVDFDNIVCVVSGIGITPAMGTMQQLASRHIHLIWVCRDASLIEFFLDSCAISLRSDTYNLIYYTGMRNLVLTTRLPRNVVIIKTRPDFKKALYGIMNKVNVGLNIDSFIDAKSFKFGGSPEELIYAEMERLLVTYSSQELYDIAVVYSVEDKEVNNADYDSSDDDCDGEITAAGFIAMTKALFRVVYADHELASVFKSIDADGGGTLDYNEFKTALNTHFLLHEPVQGSGPPHVNVKVGVKEKDVESGSSRIFKRIGSLGIFRNSLNASQWSSNGEGMPDLYMTNSDRKASDVLRSELLEGEAEVLLPDGKNWSVLYCGGSQGIQDSLQDLSQKCGANFNSEKFDW